MRHAIGVAMARSKREIPHYYLTHDVELSHALSWLEEQNRHRSVEDRLLPAVLLYKAAARAVHDVPQINGFFTDGAFHRSDPVHLGVAIALRGGGLVAPAIHDADRLELPALMKCLGDLIGRVRSGSIRSSELSDPTLTVTALGDQGVDSVVGVIYPPQVALVGFGSIRRRPWAVEDGVLSRPVVTVSLAADHRASDGLQGARYLRAIERLLQTPEAL